SWIYTIATNAASNHMRDFKPDNLPEASVLSDSHRAQTPAAFDELSDKELYEAIESAIASLNPKEILIIKLSLLYKKRYREIARLLNMPLGSVLVCARRAKVKLRKKLKKYVIKQRFLCLLI
ncbi:MAG: sigma-70 family RNA polymerase sigma factor, partial [Candidatus Omnitrophota bacterium]